MNTVHNASRDVVQLLFGSRDGDPNEIINIDFNQIP